MQDKGVERFQHNSQNMTGLLDSTIEPTIGVNGDISNLSDTSVLWEHCSLRLKGWPRSCFNVIFFIFTWICRECFRDKNWVCQGALSLENGDVTTVEKMWLNRPKRDQSGIFIDHGFVQNRTKFVVIINLWCYVAVKRFEEETWKERSSAFQEGDQKSPTTVIYTTSQSDSWKKKI